MLAKWRRLWRDCLLAVLTRGGRGQGGGGRRRRRLARMTLRSDRVARCNLLSLMGPLSPPWIWWRFLCVENLGRKSSRSARIWSARSSLSDESSPSGTSPPRYGITCNTLRLMCQERTSLAVQDDSRLGLLYNWNFRNHDQTDGKQSVMMTIIILNLWISVFTFALAYVTTKVHGN
jgi:hypothetical protein